MLLTRKGKKVELYEEKAKRGVGSKTETERNKNVHKLGEFRKITRKIESPKNCPFMLSAFLLYSASQPHMLQIFYNTQINRFIDRSDRLSVDASGGMSGEKSSINKFMGERKALKRIASYKALNQ